MDKQYPRNFGNPGDLRARGIAIKPESRSPMDVPAFQLWLEFEHWVAKPDDDMRDDFFNMIVEVEDGRRYVLNVWTFQYFQRVQREAAEVPDSTVESKYLLPPDLFVERMDRALIESVVGRMFAEGEMDDAWLCVEHEGAIRNS